MNSFNNIVVIAVLACFVIGCEQIIDDPGDTVNVERLVVFGIVRAGMPVDSIWFSKTMPMTASYDTASAAVTDVVASITVDGNTYPLHSEGGGYFAPAGLTAQSGKTYSLAVSWHGGSSTAQTTVPFPARVDSVVKQREMDSMKWSWPPLVEYFLRLDVEVHPRSNQVYFISADSIGSPTQWETGTFGYYVAPMRDIDTLADGHVHITTSETVSWTDSTFDYHSIGGYVTCTVYDAPFYDYYITRPSTRNGNDSPFDVGGSPQTVRWNVHGAAIGMFIGQATTKVNF